MHSFSVFPLPLFHLIFHSIPFHSHSFTLPTGHNLWDFWSSARNVLVHRELQRIQRAAAWIVWNSRRISCTYIPRIEASSRMLTHLPSRFADFSTAILHFLLLCCAATPLSLWLSHSFPRFQAYSFHFRIYYTFRIISSCDFKLPFLTNFIRLFFL